MDGGTVSRQSRSNTESIVVLPMPSKGTLRELRAKTMAMLPYEPSMTQSNEFHISRSKIYNLIAYMR